MATEAWCDDCKGCVGIETAVYKFVAGNVTGDNHEVWLGFVLFTLSATVKHKQCYLKVQESYCSYHDQFQPTMDLQTSAEL